jgi:fructokinase
MADIVKLSDEDLDWFGESGSHDEIAARWLQLGPNLVVITRGSKGAVGYTARGQVEVPAAPVRVADTVGAGDTFNAGILGGLRDAGLLSKASIQELSDKALRSVLEFAIEAAAITVSRPGANPPWRHELT